ncbi:hypothetical protein [Microbacterium sp.]|uniref:hypothetical protein n=1 Tax=Microbacterium sp. TaxID=51671 RepID=UPI00273552F3|nr:hypothetical protein [Microbacterium sp.]MDP3950740.1 hypothetical protein [Microbacterium sp.]
MTIVNEERYLRREHRYGVSPRVDLFVADLRAVFERHGLALECNCQELGAFSVIPWKPGEPDALAFAFDDT